MAWVEPKTNWKAKDFFNAVDYNRIINNLKYLKDLASELYGNFNIDNMQNKTYTSGMYAKDMNAIEDSLDAINLHTYKYGIGAKSTYFTNGKTPTYKEFNRIESATLKIYNSLWLQKNIAQHFEFRLGSKALGKRCKYYKDEIVAYRFGFRLGKEKGVIR